MIIAVDIDGVCADMVGGLMPYAKTAMPGVKRGDLKDYDFESVGLDKIIINEILTMWEKTGEYLHLDIIPGAVEGVNRLKKKHGIYMISARDQFGRVHQHTEFWLNLNKFKYDRLYTGAREKTTLMKFLKIDLAIDDAPHHAEQISGVGIPVFLFDASYNQHVKENSLIKRVYGWQDILERLE